MQQVVPTLQEVQQTQKLHSSMLQSLQRQLNATIGAASAQIPTGLSLPIPTLEELTKTEQILYDAVNRQIMVCLLQALFECNLHLRCCGWDATYTLLWPGYSGADCVDPVLYSATKSWYKFSSPSLDFLYITLSIWCPFRVAVVQVRSYHTLA